MSETLKNIITFGGHKKINIARTEFEAILKELKSIDRHHTRRKKYVKEKLDEVVELKMTTIKEVSKIKKITALISIKDRELLEKDFKNKDYKLADIENNLSISENLINLGKSSFQGIAISGLSVGATWSTVGALASASTGTAISSLSGAAATNATLAWFGGGSLASGGLGIAGGTAVLGGLIVIPALIITGLIQYKSSLKKVEEIQEQKNKALENISLLNENLIIFKGIIKRVEEFKLSLNKSIEVFNFTYKKTYWKIYKFGIFSKFYKTIMRKLFNKPFFNEKDLVEISHLGKCTSDIMKIIDTKIL
jgi:hypothetical protein